MSSDAKEAVAACTGCGLCLPSCPTYALWGDELDGPRGRLRLAGQVLDGAPSDAARTRLDRCLGCQACVEVCPVGVRYDLALESARAALGPKDERQRRWLRVLSDRRFAPVAGSRLGSLAAWWIRRLGRTWLAPLWPRRGRPQPLGAGPTAGPVRARVTTFDGCSAALVPEVATAVGAALAAEGVKATAAVGVGCCGAIDRAAGEADGARAKTAALAERLSGEEPVVVHSTGCTRHLRSAARLFSEDDPRRAPVAALAGRVGDWIEIVDQLGPVAPLDPLETRAIWGDPCSLRRGGVAAAAVQRVLGRIAGLDFAAPVGAGGCCGGPLPFSAFEPGVAAAVAQVRLAEIDRSGADFAVVADPGCLLQLDRHRRTGLPVVHAAELYAAQVRRTP